MRTTLGVALVLMVGCSAKVGGGGGDDGPPAPQPDAWQISVDYSGLDRFVPTGTSSATLAGTVTASQGLAGLTVAGADVATDGSGAFSTPVTVMPGLTPVAVRATDDDGNVRKADRTFLQARFLPEGTPNTGAASVVLSDAILSSMGSTLAGDASSIDVAGQILAMPYLSQDNQCETWPVSASQGTVGVELLQQDGGLYVHVQIPDLYVYFEGDCQGLISTIPIAGQMQGTIDLMTQINPQPPADGMCVTSFDHTTPDVQVSGWQFDVWGTGGPLQNWIIQLFSGSKSQQAEQQLADQMQTQSDAMLNDKLSNLSVFDTTSSVTLLGQPVAMHLCLGGITSSNGALLAQVSATAQGAGGHDAPGAPQIDGDAPAAQPGELLLDSNVVGQLLFSAWRAGGLDKPDVQQVDASLIELLVPDLQTAYPDATSVDVSIEGQLPPTVVATGDHGGNLRVELGDLMLHLTIGSDEIFRFGVHLTLDLNLAAQDGMLVPNVVATHADVTLLGEAFDGPDEALEQAVKLKIGDAAAALLGGAALTLPSLPGMGTPTSVTADAGGRYLHIAMQ